MYLVSAKNHWRGQWLPFTQCWKDPLHFLFLGAWEGLISGGSALAVSLCPVRNLDKSRWQISETTGHHVHRIHWWQWQAALKPSATHWCTLEVESSHSAGTVCVLSLVLLESQSQRDTHMRSYLLNQMFSLPSSKSHCQKQYPGIFLKERDKSPCK